MKILISWFHLVFLIPDLVTSSKFLSLKLLSATSPVNRVTPAVSFAILDVFFDYFFLAFRGSSRTQINLFDDYFFVFGPVSHRLYYKQNSPFTGLGFVLARALAATTISKDQAIKLLLPRTEWREFSPPPFSITRWQLWVLWTGMGGWGKVILPSDDDFYHRNRGIYFSFWSATFLSSVYSSKKKLFPMLELKGAREPAVPVGTFIRFKCSRKLKIYAFYGMARCVLDRCWWKKCRAIQKLFVT